MMGLIFNISFKNNLTEIYSCCLILFSFTGAHAEAGV